MPRTTAAVTCAKPPSLVATTSSQCFCGMSAKRPSTSRYAPNRVIRTSSVRPVQAKAAIPSKIPATPRIARGNQLTANVLPILLSSDGRGPA